MGFWRVARPSSIEARVARDRWSGSIGMSRTKFQIPMRRRQFAYGARYPAFTSRGRGIDVVMVVAARANPFRPRVMNSPREPARQMAIRFGSLGTKKAAVFITV